MKTIMLSIILIFSIILNISLVEGYRKIESQLDFYTNNENINFIWLDNSKDMKENDLLTIYTVKDNTYYLKPYIKIK